MKQKRMLNVKVCAKIKEDKLKVDFGYFDIYPEEYVEVTERLTAIDRDDLERLVRADDEFIVTRVLMEIGEFTQIQEELGMKLARKLRPVEAGNVGDDF